MKRKALLKLLQQAGCVLVREGARHSVFFNPSLRRTSTIPRHAEIHDYLAKKICKDLGVNPIP